MNAHASIPAEPPEADAPIDAWARPVLQRQMDLLGRLAEIGLERAEAVGREATADADPNALAMAYARIARAVRLTIMLQTRAIRDLQAFDKEHEDEARAGQDPANHHKFRVERIVERLIKAEHDDEDDIDRLAIETGDRLNDEDLYGDVRDKPVGELVALICKDLGLKPNWDRLAEQAWAKEEIESGAEGSPFLETLDRMRPPPLAGEGDPEGVEGACGHRRSPSFAPDG